MADDLSGSLDQDFSGGGGGFLSGITGTGVASGLGAVGDLLGGASQFRGDQAAAQGYSNEASLYSKAAQQAGVDTGLVQAGGAIQLAQLRNQIERTEGTAAAVEGQSGVRNNLTSATILANSQRQGALAIGQQNLQTQIEATNFELMQTGYEAQSAGAAQAASAAKSAGTSSLFGGILGGVVKAATLFL